MFQLANMYLLPGLDDVEKGMTVIWWLEPGYHQKEFGKTEYQ
jgi:hypothetical protein